jgi:peptidoglycan/xylan/chitin deacetylase (PgdA/CDA1 family)
MNFTVVRLLLASVLCAGSFGMAMASKDGLMEPKLRLQKSEAGVTRVALTFDACMGKVDNRILDMLIENHIPSTIFVTARWLQHNQPALARMKANPDLFEIEDHGEKHLPAVDKPVKVYGLAAAGSPQAVAKEVTGGADAIVADGIAKPAWFRGATAKYSPSALREIELMGYRIAGYSINGDGGSLFSAAMVEHQYAHARDGDVIISHINQPTHAAGEGIVKAILALKARGVQFVRLADAAEDDDRPVPTN